MAACRSQRVLRTGALLWMFHGLLMGATPVSRTHAHAALEQETARGMLDLTVLDGSGNPVFARLTLLGKGGEHSDAFALGARGLQVALPAGRYEVRGSRGPEWSMATQHVDLGPDRVTRTELVLRHELDPGGYIGCDFHVHSDHSPDSEVEISARVASIAAEGLAFAVPTEHNHIASYADAIAHEALGIGTLPGVELTTWAPSIGHFNVFPIAEVPKHIGRQPDELFAELRADPRVVVQVNHPRLDDHIAYFKLGGLNDEGQLTTPSYSLDFDVLEVWNGYDLGRLDRLDVVFREWLSVLNAGHRIYASGNSDAHDLKRTRPGYPRTYVWTGGEDIRARPEVVSTALKAGRAFVTSGPLLDVEVDGERPGGTVRPDGEHVTLSVRVQAASWMSVDTLTVWGGTRKLLDHPVGAARADGAPLDQRIVLEVPIRDVPFLVITVSGREPMDALRVRYGARPYGFANPIWIMPNASRATRQYSATPAKES